MKNRSKTMLMACALTTILAFAGIIAITPSTARAAGAVDIVTISFEDYSHGGSEYVGTTIDAPECYPQSQGKGGPCAKFRQQLEQILSDEEEQVTSSWANNWYLDDSDPFNIIIYYDLTN